MNRCILIAYVAFFCGSCKGEELEYTYRANAPDGKSTALVSALQQHTARPGGGGPPTVEQQSVRLFIKHHDVIVFDTGQETIDKDQNPFIATDIVWSPNSDRLAYRNTNTLRIIDTQAAKSKTLQVTRGRSLIASFRWTSNDELLVVVKTIDAHSDWASLNYEGYLANSTDIQLRLVDLRTGEISDIYSQKTAPTTFLFHANSFRMDEISPYSERVAFSDGKNLCVYDLSKKNLIANVPVRSVVEGIWWRDRDNLVIGLSVLSGTDEFLLFDIQTGTFQEATETLLPRWDGLFQDDNWYRERDQ